MKAVHHVMRSTATAAVVMAGLAAIAACGASSQAEPTAGARSTTSRAATASGENQGGGSNDSTHGSQGAPSITTPPTSGGTPVERYAACLTARGFTAVVIEGDIAYQSDRSRSGRADSSDAARGAAETGCRERVPDYSPRNDNQK